MASLVFGVRLVATISLLCLSLSSVSLSIVYLITIEEMTALDNITFK